MNLSDAVKSIIRPHETDLLHPLFTVWGETLDRTNVLPDYPRPQMVRDSYISLNGEWDYAITGTENTPGNFQGKILVPFSPEAPLSGVNRHLQPDEYLWYRITLPDDLTYMDQGYHLLLHFGAVDYLSEIYINDHHILTHIGGYLPFEVDITPYLKAEYNVLLVKVQDFTHMRSQARGKQSLTRGGIFYTAQSGIWQSVWMEWTPPSYIKSIRTTADYDTQKVSVTITLHLEQAETPRTAELSLSAAFKNDQLVNQSLTFPLPGKDNASSEELQVTLEFILSRDVFHPWSPETPNLYQLSLSFGEDRIESYFALRSYTIETHDDKPVFCLNHKPYFLMGVLDQGYWPDGLYTAPSDDAFIYDITAMKDAGFNMLRKHIKTEAARWYYHCDRLGMIVCQDMVNGGSTYHMPVISYLPTLFPKLSPLIRDSHYAALSRRDEAARIQWEAECMETVEVLSVFPSIAIWVPFNEGWGQFDTRRITRLIHEKDPTRLIDSASGWFDQNCGDFISVHNYFRPLSVSVKKWKERAFFLSEYGGYACHIKDHSSVERIFGYKRYETLAEFQTAIRELIEKSLLPLQEQGLSGAVFTQLSDVEEEVNGLLTYDRKINKMLHQSEKSPV